MTPAVEAPARRARILIVDDEPAMLRTVERILAVDHEVRGSSSPAAALELARDFQPDLAVLDIRMDELDGFKLMNALKHLDEDILVILMTGSAYDADDKLIRAIREKAFYFINKPFDREVLRTLVDRCLELRALEEANRRHLEHLESQLAEARAFQETMLPARRARLGGFEIHAAYQPCVELAGDLYDYASAGDGQVTLLIADVVGHGASAAMLTAIVKSAFRASHAEDYDPLAVVQRVSDAVAAFEPGLFVTLLCARLSSVERTLDYVNAGHDGGLLASPGKKPCVLGSTGPLISPVIRGLDLGWQRRTVAWSRNSRILLYTDGISETMDGDDDFGVKGIRRILADGGLRDAALLDAILERVSDFGGGLPAADDMTLLTARLA